MHVATPPKIRFSKFLVLAFCSAICASHVVPAAAQETIGGRIGPGTSSDTASIDDIVAALYAVISGDPGETRDWNRFRTLFHPDARMIATGTRPDGSTALRSMTPEDYIQTNGASLVEIGFHEKEIARRTESFGTIAHLFSTYEAREGSADAPPMLRGINSIQLYDDGDRWWILTVAWSPETASSMLPENYLPSLSD